MFAYVACVNQITVWCHALVRIDVVTHESRDNRPDKALARSNFYKIETRVGVRRALFAQAFELTVQAPVIFLLRRRDARHSPYPPLAGVIAHQHRTQLVAVKPVGLRATGMPVHLDTGRINHEIDHALLGQPAVQPEAVAAGLVTAVDGSIRAEVAARLGVRDGGEDRCGIACGDRTAAGCTLAITQ